MHKQNLYYKEERLYTGIRLIILFVLTLFSFLISPNMISQILIVRLVLGGLVLLSMLHYAFIAYKPDMLVPVRKNILIFLDLLTLTILVSVFEEHGLFLFAFYVLIVMQSGLSFGKKYIYTSIVSSSVGWVLLVLFSPYWQVHYEVIASFALTTFLVSLFTLRLIDSVHEMHNKPVPIVVEAKKNLKNEFLASIPSRTVYKKMIQNTLKQKETFTLLFISLDNFQFIVDKHGIDMGNNVMEEAARRLVKSINEDEFIARLGDNEFVIITRRQRVFLRKFLTKLEDNTVGTCHINGISTRIKLSIGVSIYPENGQTELILSKCADEAMHAAKVHPTSHHMFYGSILTPTEV